MATKQSNPKKDVLHFTCGSCGKVRNKQRFSATAISKYEKSVRQSALTGRKSDIQHPRCMECSGGQRHELECAQCGLTKGLDSFSRQMRKNPDSAECIDCVQEREDREPDHRIETEEQEIIEKLRTGTLYSTYGSTRGTMLGQDQSRMNSNSHGPTGFSDDQEGGWIQPAVEIPGDPRDRSSNVSELADRVRRLSTGSSATHVTNQSNTTTKTTGTAWDHFNKTYAPYREQLPSSTSNISSRTSVVSQGGNPGFAKQNAVKQDQLTKARVTLERERKRQQEQEEQMAVKSDDDEDSDSDADPEDKYGY